MHASTNNPPVNRTRLRAGIAFAVALALVPAGWIATRDKADAASAPERPVTSRPVLEGGIPVSAATPITTYQPLTVPVKGRPVDLQLKISAPTAGKALPVILLSHGHGSSNYLASMYGYAPLADFYAAHGFAVIQPTHLDAKFLGLRDEKDPEGSLHWRERVDDMTYILDHLNRIENSVPELRGRLDRNRIAVVGHSMGGTTATMLLGQGVTDPVDGPLNLTDRRIKAGVAMAPAGNGNDLIPPAKAASPAMRTITFDTMKKPALIIAGDQDVNPAFSTRTDWRFDAYTQSPGPKSLLTMYGAQHSLGGVAGYDAKETTDENPQRVAVVRAMSWAYLWSQLYPGDQSWPRAVSALNKTADALGRVESK
ncbi:alpha/beta fold hydrolase [Actinoplanes sp. LDG1-06]|uniref:Alpha/beta fold hydrolase n=1 Tax=Paractinoplanes ovalisporus TaxID=2810368 RepID=A0ABS2AUR5_9ACTN|nr:alpha/beta fold hydrolase [Actinoplanes ovalisporus]MBM2623585.1 alpha/beta fold hydrolase [Actinoplanes ovalisporus]